ncbi:lasso peptide biosynthesis B2 protein [Spirosoma aureum]|uniref:Lasso peptide biosynthesis B2 protein n=1 Tax=Spirosoma aureum TaxID=2692134 RepID=A0A6G9AN72_9BACT|nr:lasso peptide biosynthesis B2 protein [Spirosoma aureum]QIP13921.1 lasso peptide biosynthesis B2 protein [Spirosoma aureum]
MKTLKKYIDLPIREKLIFLEALFFVYAAKILLLILPFKFCVRILSTKKQNYENPEIEQLKQIKKAIHRTRWLSFWKNQCIVMSIASRWMLQRRHIHSLLSLGVAFDENKKLKAHAWLKTGEFGIVEKGGNFHELYNF